MILLEISARVAKRCGALFCKDEPFSERLWGLPKHDSWTRTPLLGALFEEKGHIVADHEFELDRETLVGP